VGQRWWAAGPTNKGTFLGGAEGAGQGGPEAWGGHGRVWRMTLNWARIKEAQNQNLPKISFAACGRGNFSASETGLAPANSRGPRPRVYASPHCLLRECHLPEGDGWCTMPRTQCPTRGRLSSPRGLGDPPSLPAIVIKYDRLFGVCPAGFEVRQ